MFPSHVKIRQIVQIVVDFILVNTYIRCRVVIGRSPCVKHSHIYILQLHIFYTFIPLIVSEEISFFNGKIQ